MAVLLMSYDVERILGVNPPDDFAMKLVGHVFDKDITATFLERAYQTYSELNVPMTMFITGMTLEENVNRFDRFLGDSKFDIQQHSYSHVPFKTIVEERDDEAKTRVFREGATLERIEEEVDKTNQLFEKHLGIKCIGITCPFAYYRGLSDRPDVLRLLYKLGIRFLRSYGRNEKDYQPVFLDVQPFLYDLQGLPDMLEIPICAWHDVGWKTKYGWNNTGKFIEYLKTQIDLIAEKDLTWSFLQHDWSSMEDDRGMNITREVVAYAQEKGVELLTHSDFYYRMLEGKP